MKVISILFCILTLVGCTRVVRTDYTVRPVISPEGEQIGERVDAYTSSSYVLEN